MPVLKSFFISRTQHVQKSWIIFFFTTLSLHVATCFCSHFSTLKNPTLSSFGTRCDWKDSLLQATVGILPAQLGLFLLNSFVCNVAAWESQQSGPECDPEGLWRIHWRGFPLSSLWEGKRKVFIQITCSQSKSSVVSSKWKNKCCLR